MYPTRRQFIATGVVASLAGCLGSTDEIDSLPRPVVGDTDADVTVIAYEDFACPACGQYKRDVYPDIETAFIDTEEIRYEHHDFPLPVNDWSWKVASAARSVQDREGNDAFWTFAATIYDRQQEYSYSIIEEVADELGFDGSETREAADEESYRPVLETDQETARERNVQATPTIVVDGRVVDTTLDAIVDAIESART
jgi:protein-disulfide isomerase